MTRRGRERHGATQQAIAAYRSALEEYTRDRVPLDWASTQNNLGYALRELGEREGGTARLEEAVAAFARRSRSAPAIGRRSTGR